MEELTSFIDPVFNLISALIGALIGGCMTRKATIEGARQAHELQTQAAKLEEDNLVNKFLWSIHDELTFLHEHYMSFIGNEIAKVDKEDFFLYLKKGGFENCLLLYKSNAALISRIENLEIRSKTIETYISLNSLFDALQEHFRLSKESYEMSFKPFSLEKDAFEKTLHQILNGQANIVRDLQEKTTLNIAALLNLIEGTGPKK
ncbi:hypothetical protein [Aeromonas hydrophila]|uniref:hypothetical protein n=1 Tax=Aeromonas hydrophila TaxID=644 RepID=UPI0020A00685|nr:hypothetical protein [Aeromonas hydrophila]MCP1268283.1 hypothetical protein [Aeromonas hydrophila]MCP1296470.1 hypothetical protein [Aeromonas hydrophila]